MSIKDYTELQAAILDFINRGDMVATAPSFIALAESRISRELRHWRMIKRSVADLESQYNALPADFIQPVRLQITDDQTSLVSPISAPSILHLHAASGEAPGRPTHYALTAGGLELFPVPDTAYDTTLVYYARTPALSDANPTNWLLTEAPDVYLYGALVHTAPYLMHDARTQIWNGLYLDSLAKLNSSSDEAEFGGSGLIMVNKRGAP